MPGDTIRMAPGVYQTAPSPSRAGQAGAPILYQAMIPGLPVVTVVTRTVSIQKPYVVLDGLRLSAGVVFDGASNTGARNCYIDGQVFIREADNTTLADCTGNISRFWITPKSEMLPATPDGTVDNPMIDRCSFTFVGSGSNHVCRIASVRGGHIRNLRLVGRASANTGNSFRKIFYTEDLEISDSYWQMFNGCTGSCDEGGGVVIRDRTTRMMFARDTVLVYGARSHFWLPASGNAGNAGTCTDNTFLDCLYRNDTPGNIYVQNSLNGWRLLGSTFVQHGTFSVNGSSGARIDHCTFVNLADGPAFSIWDGQPFTGTMQLTGNIFYGTSAAPPLLINYDMAKIQADYNLAYSASAPSPVRYFRSCCGFTNATFSAWSVFSGNDAHSLFSNPLFPPYTTAVDFNPRPNADSPALGTRWPDGYVGATP